MGEPIHTHRWVYIFRSEVFVAFKCITCGAKLGVFMQSSGPQAVRACKE